MRIPNSLLPPSQLQLFVEAVNLKHAHPQLSLHMPYMHTHTHTGSFHLSYVNSRMRHLHPGTLQSTARAFMVCVGVSRLCLCLCLFPVSVPCSALWFSDLSHCLHGMPKIWFTVPCCRPHMGPFDSHNSRVTTHARPALKLKFASMMHYEWENMCIVCIYLDVHINILLCVIHDCALYIEVHT